MSDLELGSSCLESCKFSLWQIIIPAFSYFYKWRGAVRERVEDQNSKSGFS